MSGYAEIIIDLVSDAVDRPFHYRIPAALQPLVRPGVAVTVPFGRRRYRGYVLRLLGRPEVEETREIIAVDSESPLLNREQLALIPWLAHRSFCRRIEALHALIPAPLRRGKFPVPGEEVFVLTAAAATADLKGAPARLRAVGILKEKGALAEAELKNLGVRREILRTLERQGLIERVHAPLAGREQGVAEAGFMPEAPLLLQEEQRRCFAALAEALDQEKPCKLLLHGITASGKTEVYLQGIARCLERGKGALVLVPEIALTPQMMELFKGRFPGRTAVLHSRLTAAERSRQWMRIRSGEAPVVLGTRSAVFAPLERLGLIVLDEEHDHSYRQEEAPRYHARDVAWWRARYHRAVLLLGSATPSLESYHEASTGHSSLLEMLTRVTPSRLPPVAVVDMRREFKEEHRGIFSRLLLKQLDLALERGEQALLFINRRGFAGFLLCRECGYVLRCPSCAVSLTFHRDRAAMLCHYCSFECKVPQSCPACRGSGIGFFGAGTQRVEEEVKRLFPGVPVIRMDSDTTLSRGAHQHLYRQFREGKARILIGTQMIAKGFNFPGVTLVGVVAADTALHLPDFRAAERTFQLLTQVAGRAGRGRRGGTVIVQTYHPDHYSITAAAAHDYAAFYREELERRRRLAYPPFSDLIRFLFAGGDEAAVWEAAEEFTAALRQYGEVGEILGPAPAPLSRLRNFYRVHTIFKGKGLMALAPRLRRQVCAFRRRKAAAAVRLAVDFNPQVVL